MIPALARARTAVAGCCCFARTPGRPRCKGAPLLCGSVPDTMSWPGPARPGAAERRPPPQRRLPLPLPRHWQSHLQLYPPPGRLRGLVRGGDVARGLPVDAGGRHSLLLPSPSGPYPRRHRQRPSVRSRPQRLCLSTAVPKPTATSPAADRVPAAIPWPPPRRRLCSFFPDPSRPRLRAHPL